MKKKHVAVMLDRVPRSKAKRKNPAVKKHALKVLWKNPPKKIVRVAVQKNPRDALLLSDGKTTIPVVAAPGWNFKDYTKALFNMLKHGKFSGSLQVTKL